MTRPKPELQSATAENSEELATLHKRCFEAGWDAKDITETLSMPGAYGLLGRQGKTATGFILCRLAGDECEILSMGVAPEQRRKGVGEFLLSSALVRSLAHGVHKVFLEVAKDNPAAQDFYRALGFVEVGRRRDYYKRKSGKRIDALTLRLDI